MRLTAPGPRPRAQPLSAHLGGRAPWRRGFPPARAPAAAPGVADTSVSGIIGNWWRVKYKSAGTYATSTTLVVNVFATNGLTQ
jgi:hypothetical protein